MTKKKEVTKRPPGRPRKIASPEEMDTLIDEYLIKCEEKEEPITLMGAILHLGLACRDSLDEYGRREEYSYSVKRIKGIIASTYEKRLHSHNCTGAIFALKNMGWHDRIQQEVSGRDGGPIEHQGIRVSFVKPLPQPDQDIEIEGTEIKDPTLIMD